MKLLTELKVKPNYTENDIYDAVKKQYHILRDEILSFEIVKESIDSRKKPDIVIKLNSAASVKNSAKNKVKNLVKLKVKLLRKVLEKQLKSTLLLLYLLI